MGCQTSSHGGVATVPSESPVSPHNRRRLSVSHIFQHDAVADKATYSGAEAGRRLIKILSQEDLIDMLKEHDNRYVLCSETDEALAKKESFGNKQVIRTSCGRTEEVLDCYGIGYACHKGKKPESPNQDSWFMLQVDGCYSLYAVFDGHGSAGHYISNFVKDNLPKLIVRAAGLRRSESDWLDCLRDSFLEMQGMIAAAADPEEGTEPLGAGLAGTTATVIIHDHKERKLSVAHVGDSGACIGTCSSTQDCKDGELSAQKLTLDHKPTLPEEKTRIEKAGGTVVYDGFTNHRVFVKGKMYPGLNMSRCLGDLLGHEQAGISAVPDVHERTLTNNDKLIMLCSDGVWEFIDPQEAVDFVWKYGPDRATEAAEALAKEAWNRWMNADGGEIVDDITAILIYMRKEVQI
mmetsp:Transcript_31607/g.90707  ORF Transcript_31607/g.90707 Transcript_31607/m.90707 type:complete len:406 (-) Transcript_31607:125-1342(-)